jgi:hypothetical protein
MMDGMEHSDRKKSAGFWAPADPPHRTLIIIL